MTQSGSDQAARPQASGPYTVTAYQDANVRNTPYLSGGIVSRVFANNSYPANCWTTGDTVTDNGTTSDVWIQLPLDAGGVGYVSAIYLVGNSIANLPESAFF